MLFLGRISSIHAVPDEVSFSTYTLAKDSVMQTRINLHHADIRSFGFQVAPLDRVFLSDVFSYLTETEAMHTLKKFESQMNVDGSILLRFYRYKPRIILDGGHLQEDRCHDFANKELTGAYDFCILRRSFGFQTLPMEESRCIRF